MSSPPNVNLGLLGRLAVTSCVAYCPHRSRSQRTEGMSTAPGWTAGSPLLVPQPHLHVVDPTVGVALDVRAEALGQRRTAPEPRKARQKQRRRRPQRQEGHDERDECHRPILALRSKPGNGGVRWQRANWCRGEAPEPARAAPSGRRRGGELRAAPALSGAGVAAQAHPRRASDRARQSCRTWPDQFVPRPGVGPTQQEGT